MAKLPWGKENRLAKLRTDDGYFLWMALDHGLTLGPIKGLENLDLWVNFAMKNGMTGVVLNKGMLPFIKPLGRTGMILQTLGFPEREHKEASKVPISSVQDAIRCSADAISVQINFDKQDRQQILEKISKLVSAAEAIALPVLFMVNVDQPEQLSEADLLFAIRACSELGADAIKVPLPRKGISSAHMDHFKLVINQCPPVLFAGGSLSDDFDTQVKLAAALGFSGVCIGRNIFQSKKPEQALKTIRRYFSKKTT